MNLPLLVQPPSGGRLSGGFLYNTRMAEAGLWGVSDLSAKDLPGLKDNVPPRGLVLMDSIWLTREHAPIFLALKSRERRIGLMLHSFPSMIDATENERAPLTEPSTFEREIIDQLDVVMLPGPHYLDLLKSVKSLIVVAEPGIDDEWRARPRSRSGVCRLVSVGAVTPRKGFLDVARALRHIEAVDFAWSVVGSIDVDANYSQRLTQEVDQLPVTICGQLEPESVRRIVQCSDVLVMPSYDENHPLVLLEAIAASVPTVGYDVGASRRMLEDGREGFIVPIGDRGSLGQRLALLINDEGLRYEFAKACWQRQTSFGDWKTAASQAKTALEQVIRR